MARGWKNSTRASRLPPGWARTIRPRILRRDGYRCQHLRSDTHRICGLRATDVDHIRPGDDHSDQNLQSLCDYHHKQKSASEGAQASYQATQQRARSQSEQALLNHPAFRND